MMGISNGTFIDLDIKEWNHVNEIMKENESSSKDRVESTDVVLFDLFLDNHPDAMVLTKPNGMIILANQSFADIFHTTKEDLIGKSGFEVVAPDTGERRKIFINQVLNKKKTVIFRDHDVKRYWKTTIKPILNSEKNVEFLAVYIQDITALQDTDKRTLGTQENFFHRLIQNSSDIFMVLEKDGTIRYVSKSIAMMCGYEPDTLVGSPISSIIHKDHIKKFTNFYQKITKKKGRSKPIDYQLQCQNGTALSVESISRNLLNDPEIEGIILTTRDISERKKTEEKLHLSEERFRTIVSSMSEMIFLLDESNRFVESHVPSTSDLYVPKEQFIGQEISSVLPSHVVLLYKRAATEVRKHRGSEQFNYSLQIKGQLRWFLAVLDLHPDGKCIVASIRDFTSQIEAEKQTSKMRKYLQDVIDSTLEIIMVVDADEKVTLWNERAIDFTGYQRSEAIGSSISSLPLFIHPEDFEESISRCFQEGSYSFSLPIKTKLLGRRLMRFSSSVITSDTNETIGIIFVGRDITEESDIHGVLIRGKSYLVSEESNEEVLHLLFDIVDAESFGLIFTRITSDITLSDQQMHHCRLVHFDVTARENKSVSNPEEVLTCIRDFIGSHPYPVIYMDRSDFLFSLYGYEKVIKLLYQVNGLCQRHDAMFFVRINPHILPASQYKLIREEFSPLPKRMRTDSTLGFRLYELLEYLYLNNQKNVLVSYKMLGRQFSITKVTTARRVEQLVEKGLVVVSKKGRMKTVHITSHGKRLLQKRKVI